MPTVIAGIRDAGPHNPIREYTVDDVDLASVAANTTAEQDITVTGLTTADILIGVTLPAAIAGIGIVNARIKAANTLALTFVNSTASAVDAAEFDGLKVTVIAGA